MTTKHVSAVRATSVGWCQGDLEHQPTAKPHSRTDKPDKKSAADQKDAGQQLKGRNATIAHVLSRIREIPTRLDAAVKAFEDNVRAAGAELDAASAVASQIVANATKAARDLDTKTAALNAAFKETARNIAAG